MKKIILASGSKNRQNLLLTLGIPFRVVVSDFQEDEIKEKDVAKRAKKIALGKALKVAERHQGFIVACDTYTVCKTKILEKPKSLAEARFQLAKLSGNQATCFTGFCYLDTLKRKRFLQTAVTNLTFRKFYKTEIELYVKKFPVKQWAAAYAPSETYVLSMISRISGSLTGLTHGLPTEFLIPLLEEAGFQPRPLKNEL